MKQKTTKEVVHHFWTSTSIKGIPRAVNNRTPFLRTFWALATLLCFGMLVWQVTSLLIKYYSFIVAINSYDSNVPPDFPYVTICNQNPYDALTQFDLTYEEYLARLVQLRQQVSESSSIEFDNDEGFWQNLQSKRAFITTQKMSVASPPLDANETFIADCNWFTWNWNPVSSGNLCKQFITTRWAANYYQCYNIRPPTENLMGLSAVFYIDNFPPFLINSTTLSVGITMTEGARLYIHAPSTYSLVVQHGVNMSPGTEVTIRMDETKATHLGEPYSSCTDQKMLSPLDPYIYTQEACLTICRQQQYIDYCKCAVAYEGYLASQIIAANYTFCNGFVLNPQNESDVMKILQNPKCDNYFWPQNDFCNCNQPCNEITYSQTVTTVAWPNPTNQLAFYDKYIQPHPEIYGTKFDDYGNLKDQMQNMTTAEIVAEIERINLIPANFMQLNLQMSKQLQIINDDIASVTWDTLFSDLGGTLNLWMGITVLFAAEVVELMFHMLHMHFCSKATDVNRCRTDEDDDPVNVVVANVERNGKENITEIPGQSGTELVVDVLNCHEVDMVTRL